MKRLRRTLAALLAAVLVAAAAPAALAVSPVYATRGQVADLLVAAADSYNPGVKRSDILKGYADGQLHENAYVTRAQALVMLERAFGTLPKPAGDNARSGYSAENFTDVPAWAKTELESVLASGIVAGTTASTFSPNANVTQHQMELFIQRVYALEGSNLKDDFYAAVNKKQLDESVIQPGYNGTGTIYDLGTKVDEQVAGLIREAAANPKTDGERKISALYNNILDMDSRNKAGITPLRPYLTAADSAQSVGELLQVQNDVYRDLGGELLLGFGLTTDDRDSEHYILSFSGLQPGLGQAGYAGASGAQKDAYTTYVKTLLKLEGQSDEAAAAQAQMIWDADAKLAAASLTNQERSDVDQTYNLYTMAQLKALFPHADLDTLFAASGFRQTDKILVRDVGLLKANAALFDDAHLELLKAYFRMYLAASYGALLNREFTDASNAFQKAYVGTEGTLSDEAVAAQYVQSLMSDYLGEAYVSRYFSARAKDGAEGMVREILGVYKERIANLSWMSAATKAKAIRKLDTMKLHIGYPDAWDDVLRDTPIRTAEEGGSFLDNTAAISKAYRDLMIKRQDQTVDKDEWGMSVYTVNAYYDPSANSINFPAGILQSPYYDVNASYEKNLGGIGYVIAHEITHAFDNNGAKYDENGNAADWWTPADYEAFRKLCDKVVAAYDGKEIAPGITCSGALTLSENIADLGSAACITEMESRQARPDYRALYTAMSQIWCSSAPRAMKQYLAQGDVHAPDKLRGSLVLQQFQQFYDAFGITEGDGMWIAPKDRVTIW
ncbi:MAG: S-layer homology domain-containing protein [Oscillibacter sp.]|nr:S-layer homology domain-containing protein [Oscillibacter sp.]